MTTEKIKYMGTKTKIKKHRRTLRTLFKTRCTCGGLDTYVQIIKANSKGMDITLFECMTCGREYASSSNYPNIRQ